MFSRGDKNRDQTEENAEETGASADLSAELTSQVSPNRSDGVFDDFLEGDDESVALTKAKAIPTNPSTENASARMKSYNDESVEKLIDNNIKMLREKYPMGGIKSSRFITTDVLMKAPPGYFDQYRDIVKAGVASVQLSLADTGKAPLIAQAAADPTNEDIQDEAYRTINALSAEFIEKHPYRGRDKVIALYLISSEIIGFGPLEPLWRDPRISEILVNGPLDVQIEIRGQLYKVKSCTFRDQAHLMALLERLFAAVGKQLSHTTPLLNGRLHDNSRIYATHPVVSPAGPNFSIRRHPDVYITPDFFVDTWKGASQEMMADLGNFIYRGASYMVLGGTGTGKTTLLNTLSGFIPLGQRIVTIEDNLELKIHPDKFLASPLETVPPRPDRPDSRGTTLRDLVKGSLRLRPDHIYVGEVRDESAYDMCQALSTGHTGASTVHAYSEHEGIYRIVSLVSQGGLMAGDAAFPLIASAFDIFIQLERFPEDGSRRIVSISEVSPYAELDANGRLSLPTRQLWRFENDGLVDGKITGRYVKVGELGDVRKRKLRMEQNKPLSWEQLRILSSIAEKKGKKKA